jgi:hypothetical protein
MHKTSMPTMETSARTGRRLSLSEKLPICTGTASNRQGRTRGSAMFDA